MNTVRGRMHSVGQIEFPLAGHAVEKERIEHEPFVAGKRGVDRIEGVGVVAAQIGRRIHTGKQDRQTACLQPGDDLRQVLACNGGIDAPERVVCAQFDDDGIRVRASPPVVVSPETPAFATFTFS